MAKKVLSASEFADEMNHLADYLKGEADWFQRSWERHSDYQRWSMNDKYAEQYWQIVAGLPPLIAAAREHGQQRDGAGKWIWRIVSPDSMENIFGEQLDRMAEQMKEAMDTNWEGHYSDPRRRYEEIESYVIAYRRLKAFAGQLKDAGIKEYKTDLADHGLSAKEIKTIEKWLNEKEAEIEAFRNPAPKESLFEAPKKGKYPQLDDTDYVQYLVKLRDDYQRAFEGIVGFAGLSFDRRHIEELQEKLREFDYMEICAVLGAQKRWPPEDDYHRPDETYAFFAQLPEKLKESFEGKSGDNFEEDVKTYINYADSGYSMVAQGISGLRHLKAAMTWVTEKLPFVESARLSALQQMIATEYDSRWSSMSGGPLHEKLMKTIVFTSTPTLPTSEDDIPDALNPAKEPVYAHILMSGSFKSVMGDMMFFDVAGKRFTFTPKNITNPDSAYIRLDVLPDAEIGRHPDLIHWFGDRMLESDGSLEVTVTPAAGAEAAGTLKMKMAKADAGKLKARINELAEQAEANRTAEAVLPDVFAKPRKTWYKDAALSKEKVAAALATALERKTGQPVKILAMCINHYRGEGYEWDVETTPLGRPVARLTFSYLGMVYECGDKTYCITDGVQLRQFYMPGEGYGDAFNVIFWTADPFALPAEQVKRLVP